MFLSTGTQLFCVVETWYSCFFMTFFGLICLICGVFTDWFLGKNGLIFTWASVWPLRVCCCGAWLPWLHPGLVSIDKTAASSGKKYNFSFPVNHIYAYQWLITNQSHSSFVEVFVLIYTMQNILLIWINIWYMHGGDKYNRMIFKACGILISGTALVSIKIIWLLT